MLFGRLIDYAGLFPPASLSMDAAVAEYRDARTGSHAPLLGRFIVTASRLEELAGVLTTSMMSGEPAWELSVILDGDPARAAVLAHSFEAEMSPAVQIALLEVTLPVETGDGRSLNEAGKLVEPIVEAATAASQSATAFLEVKVGPGWESGLSTAIAAIDRVGSSKRRPLGAKLRCGGVVADAFPSPEQVARFISSCVAIQGMPFKATAGLHHPIRHHDHQLDVMRHGFLNLVAATVFAELGWDEDQILDVIVETDPAAFTLTSSGMAWRGQNATMRDLRRARSRFTAYGSCSFAEPTDDLVALGMLGAA